MKNLLLRVITSVVLLPLVLYVFFTGGLLLATLVALVMLLCSYEIALMVMPRSIRTAFLAIVIGLLLLLPLMFLSKTIMLIPAISIIVFVINMIFLFSEHQDPHYFEKLWVIFYFTIYVALALAALFCLRESSELALHNTGISLVLLACAATWANDTSAYFSGRFFGKHPLFKRVSAKKTWEGFFGGALGSALIVFGLFFFLAPRFDIGIDIKDCLFILLPSMLLAPLGDLIESRLKRIYDIKDSSQILPGHGGILDRIDGLLVVLPWTALYAFFIRPLW